MKTQQLELTYIIMKFALFILLFAFTTNILNAAQRYAKKHFTCFSYEVNMNDKIRIPLTGFENHIQINLEGTQNKTEALIYHGIYKTVTKILADSLQIFILPPNSLTNKAKYNIYGYPDISIQKAIRLSDTKYFFKVYAIIENDLFDDNGNRYPEGTFKPQLKIKVELYSKEGYNPIHVSEGFAEVPKPLDNNLSFISGMEFADPAIKSNEDNSTLKFLISHASIQAAIGLKYTKPKKL